MSALALRRASMRWPVHAVQACASSSVAAPVPPSEPLAAQSTPRRRRREVVDTGDVDLVAPPDPLSNIRPIIYASKRNRRPSNSPYSAAEFPVHASPAAARAAELEMAYTMHRERVDMANHRFWASTNVDFDAQLEHRLASVPEGDEAAREAALTQFYRDWQIANRAKQEKWVKDWWRDVWTGIRLQAKLYTTRLWS